MTEFDIGWGLLCLGTTNTYHNERSTLTIDVEVLVVSEGDAGW